jgi:hypothetical protein
MNHDEFMRRTLELARIPEMGRMALAAELINVPHPLSAVGAGTDIDRTLPNVA